MSLHQLLHTIMRYGGSPVGFAKLARESGLANNTVASGYIEQLSDLFAVLPSWPWDASKKNLQFRKPSKFHFLNLAVVVAFHPAALRHVHEWKQLSPNIKAMFLEWLVAQEVWRRSVLAQAENPEAIGFWQSKEHEIDFVTPQQELIEVKLGKTSPLDFGWFGKNFHKSKLTVINEISFQTQNIIGKTIEEFLLEAPTSLYYADEMR